MIAAAHSAHLGAGGWLLPAVLVAVPALGYRHAVRVRRAAGRSWPPWRTASFLAGLVLAAAAVSPPLAHGDPRAHMAAHLLLGMFAPVALVLAAPVTLLLGALPVSARRPVGAVLRSRALHVLAHPATAAVLDVGALYLLHLTPLHALARDSAVVHHLVLMHFLLAGSLFTWSIAGPDPVPRRPGLAVRVAVLIGAGAAHGYLAKLLFARGQDEETQAAAQLMYYGGDVAELALAVALFAAWYRGALSRSEPGGPRGRRPSWSR
ncbi:cytochrome c oxidase assembly protein [Pseudonocardia nigra]|uniref:cytochrome c oxidase assembly protein n=1 Tax=Pseudonocardia nigra TaxID=1921578 RepID=UPI001C5E416A|nr:cytochrome c oxidase assembly protein [Pseudonocardia nigra]